MVDLTRSEAQVGQWQVMDDGELAGALVEACPDALVEAYRRHASSTRSVARRVLCDRLTADDVVQDVFVQLWCQPRRYDPHRGTLRGWLHGQARSRSVDLVRCDAARRAREQRQAHAGAAGTLTVGPEPEVIESALAAHVATVVDALPPNERQAVHLAYFCGHSYRQVALLLQEPEGTVKARIRAGLKRLHVRFHDDGTAAAWTLPS